MPRKEQSLKFLQQIDQIDAKIKDAGDDRAFLRRLPAQ